MGNYKEIEGNLIQLSLQGKFDVIAQGNNCFCNQGAGLAPQMVKAFGTDTFKMEQPRFKGSMNKLGTIDYKKGWVNDGWFLREIDEIKQRTYKELIVCNCYTQYYYGHRNGKAPVDYEAIALCMRKINHVFAGKHLGIPFIGAGLAGGDPDRIREIFKKELVDMNTTLVIYKP